MSGSTERVWKGVSAEDRRAERRRRLIDAGIEVMGTEGARAVTVRGICRSTGISERLFYQLFENREVFVLAVYDHVIADGYAAFTAVTTDGGGAVGSNAVRQLVATWLDFVVEDPRRGRIIAVEAAGDRELARRGRRIATTMLTEFHRATRPGKPETSASAEFEVTATVLVAGVWSLLLAWLGGELDSEPSRDELLDRIVDLACRALGIATL